MEYRLLGVAGPRVSAIGFGCWEMAGDTYPQGTPHFVHDGRGESIWVRASTTERCYDGAWRKGAWPW